MTKRTILICILCLLAVGLASGAVFTLKTIAMYSGVCDDDLQGFPGLLQAAGFVPQGKCKFDQTGACPVSEQCVVNGRKGHCVKQKISKKNYCVCVPNKISK